MKAVLLLISLFIFQEKPNSIKHQDPLTDFSFFIGEWKGKGEFSNGKPIEATMSFEKTFNDHWIKHTHTDVLPNTYHALSMWPTAPKEGIFSVQIFDSFGSHRNFTTEGWVNDEVVLITETEHTGIWKWQKFIYKKTGDNSFKMTFEVSSDGKGWKWIDYLNFTRK
jgi:hypothetical protein